MKQVLQNLRTGQTYIDDVPCPGVGRNSVLIASRSSLISAGTERMLVEFGKAGLIGKAKAQPEKVRQVLDKIKTDGVMPTLEAVFNRLDEPLPLGYCNSGVVLEVGAGVTNLRPGDRVVSNGPHAEIVCVPKNLCAHVPDAVSDAAAAFTVLSSIGLQGIRLLQPTLGEKIVVYGLGLIGLVTVQLLRASGCDVLGVDVNTTRLQLAKELGAVPVNPGEGGDPVVATEAWTGGRGADGVIITASAKTDDIIHQAATMCRKRGRVVLVGVVGLNLRRNDFYEKEICFQVSCSYGPGRYDETYEQGGLDYPLGFVRWTEQRNFEAVLGMLASGRLDVERLITHRFALSDAVQAYQAVSTDPQALGIVLQYGDAVERRSSVTLPKYGKAQPRIPMVGVIGAGNFSKMTLMPALARSKATIRYIADLNGVAAKHLAAKYGAEQCVSDYRLILADPDVEAVLIAVGHNLHCQFVCEAVEAGKHAFVEKPLAMTPAELCKVLEAVARHPQRHVMVGFNRRFSPHVRKMKDLLGERSEPLAMAMTINAGIIPAGHWVHDPVRGGGRIIGEACHFLDLMTFLTGSPIRTVSAVMMESGTSIREDKMVIALGFADGSVGAVNYFGNGSKAYPKEQLEVFSEGRVLRLDNFRQTTGFGFRGFRRLKTWRQDKGHNAEFSAFVERIQQGGDALIPLEDLVNVTLASFAAMTAAHEHRTVVVNDEYGDVLDNLPEIPLRSTSGALR